MRTKLSSFGVDPYDLSIINQGGCPHHENGTGVNINIDPDTFSSHNIGEAVRKTGGAIGKNLDFLIPTIIPLSEVQHVFIMV
jgi:apolipoprotein D and lipocalin family protein